MSVVINLATLSVEQGFLILGDSALDWAGFSVSSAGDINGDGLADLIIGAPRGDDAGDYAGEAYVIYGKAGLDRGLIDLTFLSAGDGFAIQGYEAGDSAGYNVSSAGDVNGDGIDDLIIGAIYGGEAYNGGAAYVIYGQLGATRGRLDLANLSASEGYTLFGAYDGVGISVSAAGDINGDGIDDLIIGAEGRDGGGRNSGGAFVVYGKAGAPRALVELTSLEPADGFEIQGENPRDLAGGSVSSAGDVNGDGIGDLIIGAVGADAGGDGAGMAYVIFGQTGASRGLLDLSSLAASEGFVIQGDAPFDGAGVRVSSAGDVNGDGIDDLIIGATGNDAGGANAGAAYVIYGRPGATRASIDLSSLSSSDGFMIQGGAADGAGSVSSAGDVNGDGIKDMIVGAPTNGGFGAAFVIYGQAGSTRGRIDLTNLAPGDGFVIQGDPTYYSTGISVSDAGDVNGDGLDDLIVGTWEANSAGDAGAAYVIYGFRSADVITGTGKADTLVGTALADDIVGLASRDSLDGGAGNDWLYGGQGSDTLEGGLGDDRLDGDEGADTATYARAKSAIVASLTTGFATGEGRDRLVEIENLTGSNFDDQLTGDFLRNILDGGDGNDLLAGLGGDDRLAGGGGQDSLMGGKGADQLDGGRDADILVGGSGADILTGGQGSDIFRYLDVTDSQSSDRDLITDMKKGADIIDLSSIDADTGQLGNQGFRRVSAFTGNAGEMVLSFNSATNQTALTLDVNGDGLSDFELLINGKHTDPTGWTL
jgi:hypothetical protein